MATVTHSRRVIRRYPISRSEEARLDLVWPGPGGRHFDLPLTDLSVSGLSFRFDGEEELGGLESGTTISTVVIRLGQCSIHGDLLVMHVTPRPTGQTYCGALFYPATDADLLQLKSAIAGIAAVMAD
jgi:hypothetical protein